MLNIATKGLNLNKCKQNCFEKTEVLTVAARFNARNEIAEL